MEHGWYKTEEPKVMEVTKRKLPACMTEGTLLHLVSEEVKKGKKEEVAESGSAPNAAAEMIKRNKEAAARSAALKAKGKGAKKQGWKGGVEYKGPQDAAAKADAQTAKNAARIR